MTEDQLIRKKCEQCKKQRITTLVVLKQNVSFFFQRREREFSGYVCFPCMSARFIEFEFVTLIGTWWGIIVCILGPIFILRNLLEYLSGSFLIARDFIKLRLHRASDQISQGEPINILNMPIVRSAEALVNLFKTADASTLIYDEGRRWLDQFLRDADDDKAPGSLRDDAAAILNYVGASRPDEFTTEQYNKFLYRFESYLLEDTAPSRELARVFLQYRHWLRTAYETLDRSNVTIHADIRDWYNRVLSVQSQDPVIVTDRRKPVLT